MRCPANFLRAVLLAPALVLLAAAGPLRAADLPGDSIYRLPVALTDQDGRNFQLGDRRGTPQLVSMFYTSCQYVCPLIIDTLKKTQAALTPAGRSRLQVLLVSFDSARDTSGRLKQVFAQRKLDAGSWALARTEPAQVRKLAAVLDIQYRALPDGDFSHSTALVLLDREGRIVARTDRLGAVDADFVGAVQRTVGGD
jgi:protein SCO1/2